MTCKGNMLAPDQTLQARYWLVFSNQVKSTAFTSHPVDPIEVAIYDTCTKSNISSECFLSSAKVRLTVLSAELWENKEEYWSRSEFNQSVLRPREGKGPILTGGSLTIRLKNGLGTFRNIIFTDNSSWTRSGFRLGVMVEGEGKEGFLNGERVQEGVSEPFRVKDRRVKDSQKPDLLKLTDKVQSLERVGKDRASLLQKNNIITVEDFLRWYYNNEPQLCKILCIKSESNKGWKSMVEHALQCADEFYAKYNALNNSSQPPQALVQMPARTTPLQTNGGYRLVGSCSSVPNPCENNLLSSDTSILNVGPIQHMIAGVLQVEVSSGSELMDNLLAFGESTPNSNFQYPSRSNSFDADSCEALVQRFKASMPNSGHVGLLSPSKKAKIKVLLKLITFLVGPKSRPRIVPKQALVCSVGRNTSLLPSASPSENNSNDKGDVLAIYRQLSPICYIPPLSPTDSVEHPVETQCTVFYDRNRANVESGNILNGDAVQLTNGGGFPQFELSNDLIPMEDLNADAESTPHSFGVCFTENMSNSVYGVPLTPRGKRKIKALLRSISFLAVPRKRARITPPANQTTVLAV